MPTITRDKLGPSIVGLIFASAYGLLLVGIVVYGLAVPDDKRTFAVLMIAMMPTSLIAYFVSLALGGSLIVATGQASIYWMWILYIPYLLAAAVNLIVVYLAGLTTQAVVTRLFGKRPG